MAQVTEWQIGVANPSGWPLGQAPGYVGRVSDYVHSCRGPAPGEQVFLAAWGAPELWIARRSGVAGFHLRWRGCAYEFLRSGAV